MGVFDLRCGISGLSVARRSRPERFDCSMLLLEDLDGLLVPVMPPVTGAYHRYGAIELRGEDAVERAHADWVGGTLDRLWGAGALRSSHPEGLERGRDLGGRAATYLAHAADSVFSEFDVSLDGERVLPCLFRADVAAAIAASPLAAPAADEQRLLDLAVDAGGVEAYADWLERQGRRVEAAFARRSRARAAAGIIDSAPEASRAILERFRRVLRYVAQRGGLRPIVADDGWQHEDDDLDRFAQEAWDSGDPVLRELLDRWERADAEARDGGRPFEETAAERARAATPVTLDSVAQVLRQRDAAKAEAIVAAIARAPQRDRVLDILRAPRSVRPAALAPMDGVVARRPGALVVRNDDYPDQPAEITIARRKVIVADGARVSAGDRLTEGERDVHDLVRILGNGGATDALIDALAPLLDVGRESLTSLVEPMLGHLVIEQTMQRVSLDAWDRLWAAGAIQEHGLHGRQLITSYATLAGHVDPTLGEILAEKQRREAAQRSGRDYFLTLRRGAAS